MLDRHNPNQIHYYQPGIGTNTSSIWESHDAHSSVIKRWYSRAKDAAFGSTFDDHVMAGYRFLMRFYYPGDVIYMFGFSRGAYVARILSEMLDHVGLLEAGNEGKVPYVWSVFAKWGRCSICRQASQKERDEIYRYMKALRETFCRPVSQVRFLGLFDTVNSIPRFEIYRSKLPLSCATRTSAKNIRHALSIDEHRAKFREEPFTRVKPSTESSRSRSHDHQSRHVLPFPRQETQIDGIRGGEEKRSTTSKATTTGYSAEGVYYRPEHRAYRRSANLVQSRAHVERQNTTSKQPVASGSAIPSGTSTFGPAERHMSLGLPYDPTICPSQEFEDTNQSIEEVWFPGCHADIGGGLKLDEGESFALSHVPLVWMVHEAQRAGLEFDTEKLKQFHCFDQSHIDQPVDVTTTSYSDPQAANQGEKGNKERSEFEDALWKASTRGQMHDCLQFRHGTAWPVVLSWKIVEYLPFRRLTLQKNGSWKPIRWPLPLGERRVVPEDAQVHGSAFRRMEADSNYRPKNLVPKREKDMIGEYCIDRDWEVHAHYGCPVHETYHRRQPIARSHR